MSLSPALAAVERELVEAQRSAQRLVDGLTEDEWSRKPLNGGWSAAECLTHLNLTSETFLPFIREAVERGTKRSQRRPRRDITGWLLCRVLEPPVRRMKTKTTSAFDPSQISDRHSALRKFTDLQSDLVSQLRAADGLDLGRLKITSPFNQRIRYNLYSCFRIVAVHQRRHLWQAEQATKRR